MKITAIHKGINDSRRSSDFLRFALSDKLTSRIIIDELAKGSAANGDAASTVLLSRHWVDQQVNGSGRVPCYDDRIPIQAQTISNGNAEGWLDICDGRFLTSISNNDNVVEVLNCLNADVILV